MLLLLVLLNGRYYTSTIKWGQRKGATEQQLEKVRAAIGFRV
jgi:hypothetical protein